MKTTGTLKFILFCLIVFSLMAACAPVTASSTGTPPIVTTTLPEIINSSTPEVTPVEEKTETTAPVSRATPDVNITATAQAVSMQVDMKKLADEKLVSSSTGQYYTVQNFSGEWAKLSYYHWWPLNRKPTNFAIRADVTWESAMPNANPSKAGCGFVFHENGPDNLHITYLSTDGYVRNHRTDKRVVTDLKANWAGKFDMTSDSAQIMLVVDYQWITVFVNGKQIVRFQDDRLNGGGLAYAIASGSNNDFGTRCTFENVELWEFN